MRDSVAETSVRLEEIGAGFLHQQVARLLSLLQQLCQGSFAEYAMHRAVEYQLFHNYSPNMHNLQDNYNLQDNFKKNRLNQCIGTESAGGH